MKNKLRFFALFLVGILLLTACGENDSVEENSEDVNAGYLSKVDVDYSFNFAKSLEEFKSNEKLGYRPAGSQAEIETGKKIFEEMKAIGLEEVTGDEITVDSWEFEKAELSFKDVDGNEYMAVLGGYQTNFDTQGNKEFEILYANKGTKDDLEDLDIEDKLVLLDINQDEEWWVNYPAYQAYLKGAAAIILVQEAGFSEVDPTALNAQDICGPADAAAFSMSKADADILKEAIGKSNDSSIKVNFDAKSTVEFDKSTYNYYGKIIGKDPESYIILSAHYDSYFAGFQDDNAAIALMLGVAKGLIDSDYKPEKTIIFNALAAEEWGTSNTRYDWSTGAYNQIFRVHPEWVGKAVVDLNFELPAYEHTSADEIRAVYELHDYLEKFAKTVPSVEGVYKYGIDVVSPLRTWSDDFSFSIAGVPALRNDFQDSDFMRTHYHTQFDNEDTYNEKSLLFHQNLYGLLTIHYDRTAVVPLDFTLRLEKLKESIDQDIFTSSNVDSKELVDQIDRAIDLAEKVNLKVDKVNEDYIEAINKGDTEASKSLYEESRQLNQELLKIFKLAQDDLVRLTWEDDVIFPHEHGQYNIENLNLSIEALEKGDIDTALDEYLWLIDNNWYAYHFDQDVYRYFTDYVLEQPEDRLLWGYGRILGHEDLYDLINSLMDKQGQKDLDLTGEIARLNESLESQRLILKSSVDEEVKTIKMLADLLSNLE